MNMKKNTVPAGLLLPPDTDISTNVAGLMALLAETEPKVDVNRPETIRRLVFWRIMASRVKSLAGISDRLESDTYGEAAMRAVAANSYVRVDERIARLLALEVDKIALTTPDGERPYSGLTGEQLAEALAATARAIKEGI
mgnify:FL=1